MWLPEVMILITCRLIQCKRSLLSLLVCGDIKNRKFLFSGTKISGIIKIIIFIIIITKLLNIFSTFLI